MTDVDKDRVVGVLNRILEAELAGVVRYTHYSFLVFGFLALWGGSRRRLALFGRRCRLRGDEPAPTVFLPGRVLGHD